MKNSIKRVAVASAIGMLGIAGLTGRVSAQAQDDLRRKVDDLEQQLRILKRQLELDKEASTEKAKGTPVITAGANGFTIRSADTNFVLKMRGYIQADARFFPDDHSGGTANDTFLLRRVRPIVEGTVYDKFDYRVMLDFGSGQSASASNDGFVQDAYANARFHPALQLRVGKDKEPVGLERLQSGGNLLFVERAAPTLLVPNRDVGVQLRGEVFDNRLEYQLGVFNGVADAGSGDLETSDDEKDIVARFFAQPFKASDHPWLRGIGFGLAGTFGNQEGALRTFVSPGQQRIFNYRSGAGTNAATANVVADGDHWRLAPQFWYYKGPFGLFGEYVISDQIVRRDAGVATFGDLRHSAWQVAASYFLTGEENSFGRINILKPFTIGGDGWGAWEVAARVHRLDVDNKTFPLFANPSNSATETLSWTLGLNWHLNRFFKFNLNYEQTDFTGGDASPLLKKGEKVILTRAQVSF